MNKNKIFLFQLARSHKIFFFFSGYLNVEGETKQKHLKLALSLIYKQMEKYPTV